MLIKNKSQRFVKKQKNYYPVTGLKKLKHLLGKYTKLRVLGFRSFIKGVMPTVKVQEKKSDVVDTGFIRPASKCEKRNSAQVIPKSEIELGKLLGVGGFGSVYIGNYKKTSIAVKVMHKQSKNPDAQHESFRAEMNTLNWDHPNIVKMFSVTSLDLNDGAWVLMEYVEGQTLQSVINNSDECMGPERRLKYSLQLAKAINFSHQNNIVHLDIKPANILVTMDDNIKLGDFGCSQKVEIDTGIVSPTQRSVLTGTFAYRAPELLRGEPPSKKADVYAYGVTLWQMLSRENPYGNENQHVVIFSVVAYGQRPKHPDIELDPFEECYRDLYVQCWSAVNLDRPSSKELEEVLTVWKTYM